ncbi:MAG: hypothetical protein ACI4B6_09590 [Atopobiaceae bacterium]
MSSTMVGCVTCLLVGGLIVGLAAWQIRNRSVRLLHSYHYVHVSASDQPALAIESGRWLAAIGVIVMLLGFALALPQGIADVAGFVLVVALVVCIWNTCGSIVKYNGSLFG